MDWLSWQKVHRWSTRPPVVPCYCLFYFDGGRPPFLIQLFYLSPSQHARLWPWIHKLLKSYYRSARSQSSSSDWCGWVVDNIRGVGGTLYFTSHCRHFPAFARKSMVCWNKRWLIDKNHSCNHFQAKYIVRKRIICLEVKTRVELLVAQPTFTHYSLWHRILHSLESPHTQTDRNTPPIESPTNWNTRAGHSLHLWIHQTQFAHSRLLVGPSHFPHPPSLPDSTDTPSLRTAETPRVPPSSVHRSGTGIVWWPLRPGRAVSPTERGGRRSNGWVQS